MKKRFAILMLVFVLMFSITGCLEPTTDDVQKQQSEELMKEAQQQIGMPNIDNFFEKKMLKEVLEKCDDPDLVTFLYTQNLEGKFIYIGRGIGFGIPYSLQFTNPERKVQGYDITLPQADPSGVFKPEGLSATWYMLVDEETGESSVQYFEQEITVTQNKLPARLCAEWSLPENY